MHAASLSLIPPGTGGVRDFASMLGGGLDAPVMELSADTDTRGLSGDMLLLHFSGYGFQKRGVPAWLLGEMQTLRSRFRVFGVVFHELFASGPPWSSAFWLRPAQKRIARDLLRQADFWLANREVAADWLRGQASPVPHRVLPVFSNVGEPPSGDIDRQREPTLVVFGSAGIRTPAYLWREGEIFRFAQRHGLRIHDIGPRMQDATLLKRFSDEGVVAHGLMPADEVSRTLGSARYGALVYPSDFIAKSGVFAAYAAHGTCPILLSDELSPHDGMQANVQYAAGFGALDGEKAADPWLIGRSARRWYEPHSVAAHTAALKALRSEVRA